MNSEDVAQWQAMTIHHVVHGHRKPQPMINLETSFHVFAHQCKACGWRNSIDQGVARKTMPAELRDYLATPTARLSLLKLWHAIGVMRWEDRYRLTAYDFVLGPESVL